MKPPAALIAFAAMLTTAAQPKDPSLAPGLVIVNASIHTMDETKPTAAAVALLGNRIVAVGSTAEIRLLAGPRTRVIDAKKRVVLPGFNDSHVHWLMGGFSITN